MQFNRSKKLKMKGDPKNGKDLYTSLITIPPSTRTLMESIDIYLSVHQLLQERALHGYEMIDVVSEARTGYTIISYRTNAGGIIV